MDLSEMITVLIGSWEKAWVMPSSLLIEKSELFAKALQKHWKEAEERVVRLPDVAEDMFAAYAEWVYKGNYRTHGQQVLNEWGEPYTTYDFHDLVKLWITADQLGDIKLRNNITDTAKSIMITAHNDISILPTMATIKLICDMTMPESTIRRLLLDSWVAFADPDKVALCWEELDAGFRTDVVKHALKHARENIENEIRYSGACEYHEHDERTSCQHTTSRRPSLYLPPSW